MSEKLKVHVVEQGSGVRTPQATFLFGTLLRYHSDLRDKREIRTPGARGKAVNRDAHYEMAVGQKQGSLVRPRASTKRAEAEETNTPGVQPASISSSVQTKA
jgi:hypothetical protein